MIFVFYVTREDISTNYIIHKGNRTCVTRLISTRVIACCLRRKEGELRTFRSYTEEEILFWVWFNRQEAAETHCSVMLFLWAQDSQVSLWVFFLPRFKICHWYFWLSLCLVYALNKKVQTVCCSKLNTYIEQRTSLQETCPSHIWIKIDQKRNGIWSLEMFLNFCHRGHYLSFISTLKTIWLY